MAELERRPFELQQSVVVHYLECKEVQEKLKMALEIHQQQQKSTKDNFCEPQTVDHQFYSYFNQTSSMSLINPQLIAHQTAALLSAWPFHSIPYPSPLFGGWPMIPTVPFEAKPLISPVLSHHGSEKHATNNNNYLEENRNEKSYSSTSISSPTHSSDSLESSDKKEHQHHVKGAKVFTCKVCDKTFGYKHVLQNHEKTHTGEKSYACSVCNKRFRRDHHLKVHMRLHSGEKPFSCSFPNCDRQFVQVANLRRHMKTHDDKAKERNSSEECYEVNLKRINSDYKFYSTKDIKQIAKELPIQTEPEDLSMHTSRKKQNEN